MNEKIFAQCLDKCPFCGWKTIGVCWALGKPSYIFCKLCERPITEIEIKDWKNLNSNSSPKKEGEDNYKEVEKRWQV